MPKQDLIAAVDVGTSKISCVIGERHEDSGIEILGRGLASSMDSIKKGSISDLEECAKSIELAVVEAENSSGRRVHQVVVGVSGDYITGGSVREKISFQGSNKNQKEISYKDVKSVTEKIQKDLSDETNRTIHVIPRSYYIDAQPGVTNPVGMVGSSLEVDAYVVKGNEYSFRNITKTFHKTGLELRSHGFVFSALGAARNVIKEAEKKLGVVMIDIGAGTTKIAVYRGGMLIHMATLPIGGDSLTYDIAMYYHIHLAEAEALKLENGTAGPDLLTDDEIDQEIEAEGFSDTQSIVLVQRDILSSIIEARLKDIFEWVSKELRKLQSKGVYVTGAILTGGVANLKHIGYLGQKVLEMPVKIGRPENVPGLGNWDKNPEFSAVVGTLQMAFDKRGPVSGPTARNKVSKAFSKAIGWLHDVFLTW